MNILSQGIKWFNRERENHATESVIIRTALVEKPVLATVIEPETNVSSNGLKVSTDKYIFLVDVKYLSGVVITRGVQILRNGELYEVILDKQAIVDYNDPDNTVQAIAAQKRCYLPN